MGAGLPGFNLVGIWSHFTLPVPITVRDHWRFSPATMARDQATGSEMQEEQGRQLTAFLPFAAPRPTIADDGRR